MPAGIQAWHSVTGVQTLDAVDRLTRILGTVYFPAISPPDYNTIPAGYNGSTTHPLLHNGTPFFVFLPGDTPQTIYGALGLPVPGVTFSGNTVQWAWDQQTINAWSLSAKKSNDNVIGDFYLAYGVY